MNPSASGIPAGRTHNVQYGETLATIAATYGISVDALMQANGLTNPNLIYEGQVLNIPASQPPPPGQQNYVVQPGDTLSTIAETFSISLAALMQANGLRNPNLIYAGQVLKIPAPPLNYVPYTVQPGENLSMIAVRHSMTLQALAQLNGIQPPYVVYPGQVIRVPAGTSGGDQYQLYTVPSGGEAFFAIAMRFGISQEALATANNMRPPYVTSPGQVLRIPKAGGGGQTGGGGKTYTIQPGDNMLSISFKLGVSMEALAAANGIQPPYPVTPGQVLRVP